MNSKYKKLNSLAEFFGLSGISAFIAFPIAAKITLIVGAVEFSIGLIMTFLFLWFIIYILVYALLLIVVGVGENLDGQ